MKKTDTPIIVEQNFDAAKEKIWKAITKFDEMIKWYFDNIPDFKAEAGFRTQFNVESGERTFLHKWLVKEVVPERKIVYNWTYEKYPGSADVAFEIFEYNTSVNLQVRVIVLENFPDYIPEFKRESCIGGWEYFIKERLKQYIEKN